jgi:hypothetical protein
MKIDNLTLSFPIVFILFISFSVLLWLGIQGLYWVRVERLNVFVLFLILRSCFQFFPIQYDVGYGSAFIVLRYDPSILSFCGDFIMNGCWILSKGFFLLRWSGGFCPSVCLYVVLLLNNVYIPGVKTTWSQHVIFLLGCWIWFARIFLRIFTSVLIKGIGSMACKHKALSSILGTEKNSRKQSLLQ